MADVDHKDWPTIDPLLWLALLPSLSDGDIDDAIVRAWVGRWVFGERGTDGNRPRGVRRDLH
jgi:hypothetical protein